MKVLIADDQPMILQTVCLKFRKAGYEVIAASDGREALEQYNDKQPDLVITDLLMPYISGLELVSYIRHHAQQHTPIIMLTTVGQEAVIVDAFRLGIDDYILKPFKLNEVVARASRLVHTFVKPSILQIVK